MRSSKTVDGEVAAIFREVVGMSPEEARRTPLEAIHAAIEARSGRPMRYIHIHGKDACGKGIVRKPTTPAS